MKSKALFNLISLAFVIIASAPAGYSGHVLNHVSAPKTVHLEVRSNEVALRGESGQIGRHLQTAALNSGPLPAYSEQSDSGQIG